MAEQNELTAEQLGIMMEGILKGLSLAEVTSMKPEDIENLYALAYNLYTSSNHKDAEVVFQSLCLYNHKDVRFWMGLAGCRQANGNLKGAVDAYAMAGTVGLLKDPLPFLYAARCYIQLGEKENAVGALKGLIALADEGNPAHVQCREKAAALLALLEK
jgi:type III secretion system low calcium response chaperone LcrH/SycD